MVEWLEDLETLIGAIVLIGLFVVGLFRYGSRIGVWFSELSTENRRLYLAAIALVCWTITLAAGAWVVSLVLLLASGAIAPDSPATWAAASSMALLFASAVVAILAGIPWLALVGLVRVLRWRSRRSGGLEQGD
jgi:hypothetical protein